MKTTRRAFLGSVAAASLPVAAASADPFKTTGIPVVAENPELIDAHDRLIAARHELAEAKSALEWIADEWRHRWPLAPDELLHCANANLRGGEKTAERDIIGNFIYRNTSDVQKLSAKFRAENSKTCFTVTTADECTFWLRDFKQRKPRGRTASSLQKSRESIERAVRTHERLLDLARAYEAETADLRKAAGVDIAKDRITTADNAFYDACSEISKIPAFGPEGLQIKLEALNATGLLVRFERAEGIIGEMARFITSAMEIKGRARA